MTSSIRGNCTKKNPATCRLHGNAYIERKKMAHQVEKHEAHMKYRKLAEADMAASWVLREEKDGTTTVGVYRSGVPNPPSERGVEKGHYARADSHKPDGVQGRTDGVFASPTLGGVARWVRGNAMTGMSDVKVRELRVDIDSTYIYSVRAWENASSWDSDSGYQKFWNTGITMREYMAKAGSEEFSPTDWELLLPVAEIRSIKPVGSSRVAERSYSEWDVKEVKDILDGRRSRY